jgi:hypothetical protein
VEEAWPEESVDLSMWPFQGSVPSWVTDQASLDRYAKQREDDVNAELKLIDDLLRVQR